MRGIRSFPPSVGETTDLESVTCPLTDIRRSNPLMGVESSYDWSWIPVGSGNQNLELSFYRAI